MPLNPTLYDLLRRRFGSVRVSNDGEPMSSRYAYDPIRDRTTLDIDVWGESYAIDCPFCNDGRQRLSFNHRYGTYDEVTDSDNLHLARCFNEDCLKDPGRYRELRELVFGFLKRDQRRQSVVVEQPVRPAAGPYVLQQALPPGEVVELTELSEHHPALDYLRQRGFDPAELSSLWRVLYCTEATPLYRMAQDRLIIPIIMNGVWAGWQARHVGERDWKLERLPKYYTQPSIPKGQLLYNHDLAIQQPLVVVCEGPSDVWRVGPAGVAVLGKQASGTQLALLAKGWAGKPAVVLLDGDARADAGRLCRQLEPFFPGRLVRVALPPDRDPGDYKRPELWALIREQARAQGITLPEPVAAEPGGPAAGEPALLVH